MLKDPTDYTQPQFDAVTVSSKQDNEMTREQEQETNFTGRSVISRRTEALLHILRPQTVLKYSESVSTSTEQC